MTDSDAPSTPAAGSGAVAEHRPRRHPKPVAEEGARWGSRAAWQIKLRYLVPPIVVAGVAIGHLSRFDFPATPLLLVALGVFVYNVVLQVAVSVESRREQLSPRFDQRLNLVQVVLDYGAMFLLVHFTGGLFSPIVFFFVFHVIASAVLFPPASAWLLASIVTVGLAFLGGARAAGWLEPHMIEFGGAPVLGHPHPVFAFVWFVFIAASMFIVAAMTATIMARLRLETERVVAAVQARVRERTQFMLHVAHNLRAPLGAAVSMLTLIDQGYLGTVTAEQQAYLMRISRRLESLNDMVGELLALARGRDAAASRAPTVVEPADLARRSDDVFRTDATRKRLRFSVHHSDDAPPVLGDEEMLSQMLENLVSNAIKYTPEEGSVSVVFERSEKGWLRIVVRDTGIGIPEKEMPRLFSEFFRASNAREAEADGTGLGLAIVRQVVDRHGGRIKVESAEGAGSAFTVLLPAAPSTR